MADTRRVFLQATAAGVAGMTSPSAVPAQGRPPGQAAQPPMQASATQVPKMKFGNAEISRLVAGCNPFNGVSHFNNSLNATMSEWYTPDRVCAVLHQCNRFGINAYNYVNMGRAVSDLARFEAEGGKMHLIVQGANRGDRTDLAAFVKAASPLGIYNMGETVDRAFQTGAMDEIREWCKKVRDLGTLVGVGTHKPEVIALVEEQGWDVDFYAGCVYNRTRTEGEWRQLLNGQLPIGEIYLADDPPRMYKAMRQTRKPCFAFKIVAAGRLSVAALDQAFQTAFESIKATDGVFVGLFPKYRDEVRENAERVHRILTRG